jgi:predicted transcriptional regulator
MLSDDVKPEIVIVDPEDSLFQAVRMLHKESVHRLLVVDSVDGNALYVLTYKKILRFLYNSVRHRTLSRCERFARFRSVFSSGL